MTRVRHVAVLAALAASTLATSSVLAEPRGCYAVWVTPVQNQAQSDVRGQRSRGFSASEILDLRFLVLVPADDAGTLHLKLFTPKGHLYQELRVTTELAADRNQRRRSRHRWLSASLPVAGTTIVTSSLYGRWRAEAYVDDGSSPCARPRSFIIRE